LLSEKLADIFGLERSILDIIPRWLNPLLVKPKLERTSPHKLTAAWRLHIVRPNLDYAEENLEESILVGIAEAFLRVILGWRFLISGLSNVRRWPNPVNTASILFSEHAKLFGLVATVLMVAGGLGVAAGFQTPISSTMLFVFLIPTFSLHYYWLKVLPTMAPTVKSSIVDDKAQGYFRNFERQAYHGHEVGIRDNLVLLAATFYFAARGSGAYGLDNFMGNWVVWIF
jgi:uncharacterized membrane protein YphA (DoxX/SURF4 family)